MTPQRVPLLMGDIEPLFFGLFLVERKQTRVKFELERDEISLFLFLFRNTLMSAV